MQTKLCNICKLHMRPSSRRPRRVDEGSSSRSVANGLDQSYPAASGGPTLEDESFWSLASRGATTGQL
jgi:hypothetical protein